MVPSKASAAMPIVSDRVGCGWMVSPMSSASAPISIANAASAIRSPAEGPTMPQPMIRSVVSSKRTLVRPSSRPSDRERPLAALYKPAIDLRHLGRDALPGETFLDQPSAALAHG